MCMHEYTHRSSFHLRTNHISLSNSGRPTYYTNGSIQSSAQIYFITHALTLRNTSYCMEVRTGRATPAPTLITWKLQLVKRREAEARENYVDLCFRFGLGFNGRDQSHAELAGISVMGSATTQWLMTVLYCMR